jgi:hypothetical protein
MAQPDWLANYKSMTKYQLIIEVARIERTASITDRVERLAYLYHEIVLRGDK